MKGKTTDATVQLAGATKKARSRTATRNDEVRAAVSSSAQTVRRRGRPTLRKASQPSLSVSDAFTPRKRKAATVIHVATESSSEADKTDDARHVSRWIEKYNHRAEHLQRVAEEQHQDKWTLSEVVTLIIVLGALQIIAVLLGAWLNGGLHG